MIFKDILNEKTKILAPEFDKLLELAWKKQYHVGDLLLFHINGFYSEDKFDNPNSTKKYNPHVIGPGLEGLSEHTHYSFIHKYRTTNIVKITHAEYLEEIKWTQEKKKQIEEMIDVEETTIQIEMLIYLKFWEADSIIRKFYQFVKILHKESYDWYFKVDESISGKRHEIIRLKIRDRLQAFSPVLYEIIKNIYKTQIRNSIAHSQYSFQGRYLQLFNYVKEDQHAQLKSLPFDTWIDIFHSTLVLYNEYIRINNVINERYAEIAMRNNNTMEILVTEKDGKQYPMYVEYIPQRKGWGFKQN